jgi:predicted amidohydrolase YtcJ
MSRAELAFLGGSVITVDPTRPRAEAIAVAGGRIVAVGTDREVAELIGPTTDVIELEGRTVLPGFQDAHLHFAHGGMAARECDLYETTSPAAHAEAIVAYAARNPTVEWIVGGGWSMDDFTGGMPTREFLDALVPDRPVALVTRDGHTSWVNSRALECAGITATTPDPVGGVIDHDADGAPAGTLQETAMRLVQRLLPEPSQATWEHAILDAQGTLHALGITACQEASLDETLFAPYRAVAERGQLTMRTEGNLLWRDDADDGLIDELLDRRAHGTVGRLRIRGVKLFQDGVVESRTAAMLEAYREADGSATGELGASLFEPERLQRIVGLLDSRGFQVHIHALGDRAVRESLDAFEAAAAVNGTRDARHHLAHVQFASRADLPRFHELGVVANVTPYWAVLSGYVRDLTLPFVSAEASASMYAFGSILRAGGRLAFGSDWSVSTPDPLLQLEVAVTRCRPGEDGDEAFLPQERLTLDEAIAAATMGSAYVNHLDHVTGSIEPGTLADLVVLDRDLLDRGAGAIGEARVVSTLVEGDVVFDGTG